MKQPSTGSGGHTFARVPSAEIPRSSLDRSHSLKTTFNSGLLIPILCDEALPGDTIACNMTGFGRLNTPKVPLMDNMYLDTFFFAIPYRLVWDNWQKFNGEQANPNDSTDFLVPEMTSPAGGYLEETLEDYFGIPTKVAGLKHHSLMHRAYFLVWNEWFRDQNLQNSKTVPLGDGPDDPADFALLRRGKRHDYFTAALPWPQKGPAVPLPLTGNAPVKGIGSESQTFGAAAETVYETGGTGSVVYPANTSRGFYSSGANAFHAREDDNNPGFPAIFADLSAVTAATINELRQAWQIQRLFERDARGGSRYTEIIRSHFGVISPDQRLQRPEFLGGGSSPIIVNPVAQTSSTDATSPQANLAAIGTVTAQGHGFSKSFTEHCLILGLCMVRADLNYQQGLNRMWSRRDRFDFFWPVLAHIGEQAVLSKEIYADGTGDDELVWGYQERYAEYRYKPSQITGKFRSNTAQPLDVWHLAQKFDTRPTLSGQFIEENPPIDRIIAVPSEPELKLDCWFRYRWARPMPVFGIPGLVDHF